MIKPIIKAINIIWMLILIAFLPSHDAFSADELLLVPVLIEMKGIHSPTTFSSSTPLPEKPEVAMTVNPLRKVISPEGSDLSQVEMRLNKAILSLTNPEWKKRDIAAGLAIAGLTGLCLAYVPLAEGTYWTHEVWGICANYDVGCYKVQYIDPHGSAKVDQSITGIKIDLGLAYGVYIPARLSELFELYKPDTRNVNAIKKKRGWGYRILNAIGEVGIVTGAGAIGFITASSFYHEELSGGQSSNDMLPFAVPLGIFLAAESISPFKSLKNRIFSTYNSRKGTKEIRSYRSELIDSLQRAKHAIFNMTPEELKSFRAYMKGLSQKAKTNPSFQDGLEQFKKIIKTGKNVTLPEPSFLRRYAPKAAALTVLGASAYLFYKIYAPQMAGLYDNSANDQSAFYQMVLKYFENNAPVPSNETAGHFHEWWNSCVDGIRWTLLNINATTGEGNGEGSFGYNCAGVPYQSIWTFNLPGDIDQSPEGWFYIASAWRDFMLQYFQGFAGGTSSEIVYSKPAKQFGDGTGVVYAGTAASLAAYGVHQVSNRLGDLFVDNPIDPQPGQKSKWFNTLNLLYSTTQAAVRTVPYGMLAYLALKDMDPDVMWTIGTMALTGKTMNFITYFQERYRTIPGAAQRGWGYAKIGLKSAKEYVSNMGCSRRVTQSRWWNGAKECLKSATEYVSNMGCSRRVTQSRLWNGAKWLIGGVKEPVSSFDRVMTEGLIAERDAALKEIDLFMSLISETDDPYIQELNKIREQVLSAV